MHFSRQHAVSILTLNIRYLIKLLMGNFFKYKPNILTISVFLAMVITTQLIAWRVYHTEKENEYLLVNQRANDLKRQLVSVLTHSTSATATIGFLVERDLLGDLFDSLAHKLLREYDHMDALQLVKGNEVIKTYPLAGNEASIGFAILEDSTHRREAFKALERNELYFEGPLELIQGGIGIVGRLPIIKEGVYWGFSAVIIRIETFRESLGVNLTDEDQSFTYQLVKVQDGTETNDKVFAHQLPYNTGVYEVVFAPIGDWNIYVKLNTSNYLITGLLFSILGLTLSLVVGLFLWHLSVQPKELKLLVERKTADLEDLNKILEKRARDLRASNQELEQFAFITSHDLQEPLRMISSFLVQLQRKYTDKLDDKANRYIQFAVDGATNMREIILDILEYSKIGTFDMAKEEVNLNEILDEFIIVNHKLIKQKAARISSSPLPIIRSYKGPITQAVYHILDNAIKYAREGVPSEIYVTINDNKTHWELSFQDNGIGMESEYFDKIFIMFQRLHDRDTYQGTGIGLAIVKKIMDRMEGSVKVVSEIDKGSTFTLSIPKE